MFCFFESQKNCKLSLANMVPILLDLRVFCTFAASQSGFLHFAKVSIFRFNFKISKAALHKLLQTNYLQFGEEIMQDVTIDKFYAEF